MRGRYHLPTAGPMMKNRQYNREYDTKGILKGSLPVKKRRKNVHREQEELNAFVCASELKSL